MLHTVAFVEAWYCPAGQERHWTVSAADAYFPVAHAVQALCPVLLAKNPDTQLAHTVAWTVDWYCPVGHFMHWAADSWELYVPA
jgi:hypothetical protein